MGDFSQYPEPIRAILEAQFAIARSGISRYADEWVSLDLTMGQLKALMALAQQRMHVRQLAEALGVGKPAASIIVDRLVQLGLAQRIEDPEDRRYTLVSLTDEGSERVERLHQGKLDRLAQWLEAMNPDDLAALRRGLRALAAIITRDGAHSGATGIGPSGATLCMPEAHPTPPAERDGKPSAIAATQN
jgi:DNA-binding MarR family transcriptional regulator